MTRPPSHRPTATSPEEALLELVRTSERILLTGPEEPDGDSLGACLALARAIRALGRPTVHVAGRAGRRYRWMPGAEDLLEDGEVLPAYDLVVILDGDRHRLGPGVTRAFEAAARRAIVDHHATTRSDHYDVAYLDTGAGATCEMVYTLLEAWGIDLDRPTAELLYAGLVFDTGGFLFDNTTARTLGVARRLLEAGVRSARVSVPVLLERSRPGLALLGRVIARATFHAGGQVALGQVTLADFEELGAAPEDLERIVDALVFTEGVELAVLMVERARQRVKLSLRSRDRVDVATLAASLHPGGGGHRRAAGVVLEGRLAEVRDRVLPVLEQAVA